MLQPLDISINHVFNAQMRDQWERWMSESVHSVTIGGHIRKASYNVVY